MDNCLSSDTQRYMRTHLASYTCLKMVPTLARKRARATGMIQVLLFLLICGRNERGSEVWL